jgi:hypothetical protein
MNYWKIMSKRQDKQEIPEHILFTIDLTGVSIINTNSRQSQFVAYPEASVFLVFAEGHTQSKSKDILRTILAKNLRETEEYIRLCFLKWKEIKIID